MQTSIVSSQKSPKHTATVPDIHSATRRGASAAARNPGRSTNAVVLAFRGRGLCSTHSLRERSEPFIGPRNEPAKRVCRSTGFGSRQNAASTPTPFGKHIARGIGHRSGLRARRLDNAGSRGVAAHEYSPHTSNRIQLGGRRVYVRVGCIRRDRLWCCAGTIGVANRFKRGNERERAFGGKWAAPPNTATDTSDDRSSALRGALGRNGFVGRKLGSRAGYSAGI